MKYIKIKINFCWVTLLVLCHKMCFPDLQPLCQPVPLLCYAPLTWQRYGGSGTGYLYASPITCWLASRARRSGPFGPSELDSMLSGYLYAFMKMSSNGNFLRVTGLSWGEWTGHRWSPLTKANEAELCCFLWGSYAWTNGRTEQTIEMSGIWDALSLIMTSL